MTEVVAYLIDALAFEKLRQINVRLFGDGKHLTPDERRDLANLLHSILSGAMPVAADEQEAP